MILISVVGGAFFALSPLTSGLFWLGVANGVSETVRIGLLQ